MNPRERFPFSDDWSAFQRDGRMRAKGKIRHIYDDPKKWNVPPLKNQYTVTLEPKPDRTPTYYLKFLTKEELRALSFTEGEDVDVEGDLTEYCRRGVTKHILTNVRRTH
jgi:hypothetical protein